MLDGQDDHRKGKAERNEMPIYAKAIEILHAVESITSLIPEDDEMAISIGEFLREDAMQIPAHIASAEGGDLYDIRMEKAALIRRAGRNILTGCSSLEMIGFEEEEYLNILRESVEELKILFIEWVENFDEWNYVVDDWGLFNPEGVDPFDEDEYDMEYDEEFDNEDYFSEEDEDDFEMDDFFDEDDPNEDLPF